ncbi:MAG: prolipoprotein diacylglyceryl transferase [Acidobacteria bacterium]|nr:prolipoprotein diacylglyceryl transferase [Acidobacteriota bacterium]
MLPEIFRIGSFPVNTYGVLLALAFLAALFAAARLGERDGLKRERVFDLGLWMLVAALVGSKLLLLVVEPEYRHEPLRLLSLDFLRSGGVFYGGFLGGLAAAVFLMRRYGMPFWKTTDAFAPALALGQSIGRVGCFAAGCCWGKECALPWGVEFTERGHEVTGVPTGVHLHPTQLYESGAALLIFLFLVWLHRRKRFDGQVLLSYAVLYGAARFTIEFFRDDPRGDILGLTSLTGLSTSQLISLLVGLGGLVLLVLRRRRASIEPTGRVGDTEAHASETA